MKKKTCFEWRNWLAAEEWEKMGSVPFIGREELELSWVEMILWVRNNITHLGSDSNQGFASTFLCALMTRTVHIGTSYIKKHASRVVARPLLLQNQNDDNLNVIFNVPRWFSVIDFATFIDLTLWHRFGFTTTNPAIVEVVDGFSSWLEYSCSSLPDAVEKHR